MFAVFRKAEAKSVEYEGGVVDSSLHKRDENAIPNYKFLQLVP